MHHWGWWAVVGFKWKYFKNISVLFTISCPANSYRQMMHVRNYMTRKKKFRIWNKRFWDWKMHLKMLMTSVFYSSMKFRRRGKFLPLCNQIWRFLNYVFCYTVISFNVVSFWVSHFSTLLFTCKLWNVRFRMNASLELT